MFAYNLKDLRVKYIEIQYTGTLVTIEDVTALNQSNKHEKNTYLWKGANDNKVFFYFFSKTSNKLCFPLLHNNNDGWTNRGQA